MSRIGSSDFACLFIAPILAADLLEENFLACSPEKTKKTSGMQQVLITWILSKSGSTRTNWRHIMHMATVQVFLSAIVRGGFHNDIGFFSGTRGVSGEVYKRAERTVLPGSYYLAHRELH